MQEYKKKSAPMGAQQRSTPAQPEMTNGIPNSTIQDVFAGKRRADSSMMGHSRNLAPSIAAKMSRAFGMDLTGMQVYQSDAMAGSDMKGMAQGNKVVLSSDVDLNTTAGQAILGHEISHIHAQSQGIGMGNNGLYENAALEHQADTEGLLAAQGRSIYSDGAMDMGIGMSYGLGMQGVEGMTTLGGGMSANAGAPMQAFLGKPDEEKEEGDAKSSEKVRKLREGLIKSKSLNAKSSSDIVSILHDFDAATGFNQKFDFTADDLAKGKAYLNKKEITDVDDGEDDLERTESMLLDYKKMKFIKPV